MIAPSLARPAATRAVSLPRLPADPVAVGVLLLLTAVIAWELVVGGTTVGQDTAAFFYPVYEALGERLRGGDWLPGWNPHQFSGAPLAADPQSGWGYLPAMVLFAALPLEAAAKAFVVGHLLLAGLATYALARRLGLDPLGALAAGVAYEFSGLMHGRSVCCPAYSEVAAWVPALLLGVEGAVRARTRTRRIAWWGGAGLALSQVLAAWPGQGAVYVLLTLGGYTFYRTVLAPGEPVPLVRRLGALALHGAAVLAVGFGLAAGSLLPRLEFHRRSNLADGYAGAEAAIGGWDLVLMVDRLLNPSLYYVGGGTAVLAGAGLLLAGRRHAVPFFAALTAATLVLARPEETPLHSLLYALLPRFESLHPHWPERDMVVFYLGPAMLAGAAVSALGRCPGGGRLRVAALAPLALVVLAHHRVTPVDEAALRAAVAASIGLLVVAHLQGGRVEERLPVARREGGHVGPPLRVARREGGQVGPPLHTAHRVGGLRSGVALLLVAVVFVDLFAIGRVNLAHGPYGGFHAVDLGDYYREGGAATVLRELRQREPPFRFFGYDPGVQRTAPGQYRWEFMEPRAAAILVNNRATVHGLHDVQGYDPLQLRRYVEVMNALNGGPQEYHEANVQAGGLESPLLDLLNARYVVVPATAPPERTDLTRLASEYRTVAADAEVKVLENPGALPRAWLVHEARRVGPGEALPLLAGGTIDPRRVALVEGNVPELAAPADPAAEEVRVTDLEPDRLRVAVRAGAPALLVLSEIAYPAWVAEVDGEPAPVVTVDHALRAVAVPAGEHAVELRFESRPLRVGTAVSAVTAGALPLLLLGAWWRGRRPGAPARLRSAG